MTECLARCNRSGYVALVTPVTRQGEPTHRLWPHSTKDDRMIETTATAMKGTAQEPFANVQRLAEANLAAGLEVGLSLTVDVAGETVLDLWGGHADGARTRPWESDTIVNVWSSTKMVTCLAALMLVDRGAVDVPQGPERPRLGPGRPFERLPVYQPPPQGAHAATTLAMRAPALPIAPTVQARWGCPRQSRRPAQPPRSSPRRSC